MIPVLHDNVDETLEAATHRLNTVPRYIRDPASLPEPAAFDEGPAAPPPLVRMVAFEDENEADDAGALKEACTSLQRLEWDDHDLGFFFNKAETRMKMAGVKRNWTKFQVLSEIIPKKVQDQVKSIL